MILLQYQNLGAFFAAVPQKTGLSAPIPRICLCKSCGISAAIPCAHRGFQDIEPALIPTPIILSGAKMCAPKSLMEKPAWWYRLQPRIKEYPEILPLRLRIFCGVNHAKSSPRLSA
jgi:hypothetical protein